jgi:SPOR domain
MMITVRAGRIAAVALLAALGCLSACSREQQDWRSAESADTLESYGRFIEQHPESELVTQARTRIAQLGEDRDWSRVGSADTAAAYEQFLAQHPNGKWAQEARIRIENFALGAAPAGANAPGASEAPAASMTTSSGYGIQLGAFSSEDRANAEWRALQGRFPAQLQRLAPNVVTADTPSGRVYRLQAQAGGEARARLICEELRQQSQACVPVVPH